MRRIIKKIAANIRDLWRRYPWMVGLFFAAVFADALSTTWFMLIYGPEAELHPVVRYTSEMMGPVLGPWVGGVGKAVMGLVAAEYLGRYGKYLLVTVTILSFWAGWYNVWGYQVYRPLFLEIVTSIAAPLHG